MQKAINDLYRYPSHYRAFGSQIIPGVLSGRGYKPRAPYLNNHYNVTNRLSSSSSIPPALAPPEERLEVSKATFNEIAPFVKLDPYASLRDAATFPIGRARLPTPLFKEIVQDFEVALQQYGSLVDQDSEETRSRCISMLMARIMASFKLLIKNTPEEVIPGRFTTRGRIEYRFKVCDSLTVIFIEVNLKRMIDSADRLNIIAQVIAEADSCDYENARLFLSTPIYTILCDGTCFEFFKYTHCSFSHGTFTKHGSRHPYKLFMPSLESSTPINFICALRPICETIFWVFLSGYIGGLDAYHCQSVSQAASEDRDQTSTPTWVVALGLAQEAMNLSVEAVRTQGVRGSFYADRQAVEATEKLSKSVEAVPETFRRGDCEFMSGWDNKTVLESMV